MLKNDIIKINVYKFLNFFFLINDTKFLFKFDSFNKRIEFKSSIFELVRITY